MEAMEVKAEIFDLLREMESLQLKLRQLNQKKTELLKKLEPKEA